MIDPFRYLRYFFCLFLFLCPLPVGSATPESPSLAIQNEFRSAGPFTDNYAVIGTEAKSGVIDRDGKRLLQADTMTYRPGGEGMVSFSRDGRWGFMTPGGREKITPRFQNFTPFSEDRAGVREGEQWGYVNREGDTVVDFRFDQARPYRNGRALVTRNNRKGFINRDGDFVIPLQYNDAQSFSEGLAPVEKHDLWGYVDRAGNRVISRKYLWAEPFRENRARVKTGGKWGIINSQGDLIDTYPYEFVHDFHDGRALFRHDGRVGYLDRSGTVAIPPQFDEGSAFRQGVAPVKVDNKWGYINTAGEFVVPPTFALASTFSDSRAAVKIEGQWGYIAHPSTRGRNDDPEEVLPNRHREINLNESLTEDFPLREDGEPDRYVSLGKGVIPTEWNIERDEEVQSYNRSKLIYEVTTMPYELPEAHHREASQELLERSIRAVEENGWYKLENALEDGFVPNQSDGSHFHNVKNIQDGKTLVPERPEYLIFNTNPNGTNMLTGFMYLVESRTKQGPAVGGPLTKWHYHVFDQPYCFDQGNVLLADVTEQQNCRDGVMLDTTTEMLHVWFVNHPEGRFGTRMELPSESYKSFLYEKRD